MQSDADDEDVARRVFLASNQGDDDAFLACLDPEAIWQSAGLFLYPADTYGGSRAILEALGRAADTRGGRPRIVLRSLTARNGFVLVAATVSVPSAREHVTLPIAFVVEVRDGLVARVWTFRGEERARVEWERLVAVPRQEA